MSDLEHDRLQASAKRHLWMHFSRLGAYADADVPVIVRGEGSHVYDSRGKRYLDGLSSLFVTQIGHGREELSAAGAKQSDQLAYFPVWGYGHPSAIELSERLAERAPVTSTGCSSPPAAARRSRPPTSWPGSTSS